LKLALGCGFEDGAGDLEEQVDPIGAGGDCAWLDRRFLGSEKFMGKDEGGCGGGEEGAAVHGISFADEGGGEDGERKADSSEGNDNKKAKAAATATAKVKTVASL
jgi:hypothetical protein